MTITRRKSTPRSQQPHAGPQVGRSRLGASTRRSNARVQFMLQLSAPSRARADSGAGADSGDSGSLSWLPAVPADSDTDSDGGSDRASEASRTQSRLLFEAALQRAAPAAAARRGKSRAAARAESLRVAPARPWPLGSGREEERHPLQVRPAAALRAPSAPRPPPRRRPHPHLTRSSNNSTVSVSPPSPPFVLSALPFFPPVGPPLLSSCRPSPSFLGPPLLSSCLVSPP